MKKNRVIILGSDGFVASHVVKALENKHVFGTDKNTNQGIKYFGQSKE